MENVSLTLEAYFIEGNKVRNKRVRYNADELLYVIRGIKGMYPERWNNGNIPCPSDNSLAVHGNFEFPLQYHLELEELVQMLPGIMYTVRVTAFKLQIRSEIMLLYKHKIPPQ